MGDHVVDTNVLLVASALHPASPFDDTHVPIEEQEAVFEWLAAFRADDERRLVMDAGFAIYDEYRNQLSDQDYGLLAIHDKFDRLRSVTLSWDEHGDAVVPKALEVTDRSDRKFVAAALADTAAISIVNATDSDWVAIEAALDAAGISVIHLIESWLRRSIAERQTGG